MSLTGPDGRQIAKYDDFQHNRRMRELFARAQEVTKAAMKAKASFEKKSTEEEKPKELQTEVAGGGKSSLNYSSIKGAALGVAALSVGLLWNLFSGRGSAAKAPDVVTFTKGVP